MRGSYEYQHMNKKYIAIFHLKLAFIIAVDFIISHKRKNTRGIKKVFVHRSWKDADQIVGIYRLF